MPLQLTVVTPEKQLLSEEVDEIIVPTTSGELTILPQHAALLAQLVPGELVIKKGNKTDHLVVVGGFLEVGKNTVSILADYAVHGKDISEAQAQQAKDRAEKAMKEKKSDVDFATAEAEFRRAILELKVAKRQKGI
ncbi:MAG TPA: ATP synthase F1 subunit epsilon [Patescibacteria group bacterium]|nr:ATP synthase F1 subunit epsilon [Patescibacteria group bacterium]